jgi:hypothetical protein
MLEAVPLPGPCMPKGRKHCTSMNCRCIAGSKMLQSKSREFGRLNMASAKFFRKQAEKCAGMAKRTHDEDSRQRCEQLERTYCYLAEVEERQADDPEPRPAA